MYVFCPKKKYLAENAARASGNLVVSPTLNNIERRIAREREAAKAAMQKTPSKNEGPRFKVMGNVPPNPEVNNTAASILTYVTIYLIQLIIYKFQFCH